MNKERIIKNLAKRGINYVTFTGEFVTVEAAHADETKECLNDLGVKIVETIEDGDNVIFKYSVNEVVKLPNSYIYREISYLRNNYPKGYKKFINEEIMAEAITRLVKPGYTTKGDRTSLLLKEAGFNRLYNAVMRSQTDKLNDDGCIDLVRAIIEAAREDYRTGNEDMKEDVLSFAKSKWGNILTLNHQKDFIKSLERKEV